MKKNRIPILLVALSGLISLIMLIIIENPNGNEASWSVIFATTFVFTLTNTFQDIVKVILWTLGIFIIRRTR